MNCWRAVSTGLVSIRYFCGCDTGCVPGRPCTRAMLWLATGDGLSPVVAAGATGVTPGIDGAFTTTVLPWSVACAGRSRFGWDATTADDAAPPPAFCVPIAT